MSYVEEGSSDQCTACRQSGRRTLYIDTLPATIGRASKGDDVWLCGVCLIELAVVTNGVLVSQKCSNCGDVITAGNGYCMGCGSHDDCSDGGSSCSNCGNDGTLFCIDCKNEVICADCSSGDQTCTNCGSGDSDTFCSECASKCDECGAKPDALLCIDCLVKKNLAVKVGKTASDDIVTFDTPTENTSTVEYTTDDAGREVSFVRLP